jgi:hypothetical protein
MLRVLLFTLALGFFGVAAYERFVVRNSYSSYSDPQLELLGGEMETVTEAGGAAGDEARISRTLLDDERERRLTFWPLVGAGTMAAFLGAAWRTRRSTAAPEEDQRLLSYLGNEEGAMPGGRQHAATLLGVAPNAPASVVQAAFAALLKERGLENLDGLAPDLKQMQAVRLQELQRARDLLLRRAG